MSKILLDIQTDQEAGMAAPVVAFCLVTIMLVIAWILQPESQAFMVVGGIGLVACLGSFLAWRALNEYYELLENGELEFVRELGSSVTRKPLGPVKDHLQSVVVQTWITRHAGLNSLALMEKSGKVLTLQLYQLPEQEKVTMPIHSYDSVLQHGQELSQAIGIEFKHGEKGDHLKVVKVDGGYEATYGKESPLRPLIVVIVLLVALLPLTYFAISRFINIE